MTAADPLLSLRVATPHDVMALEAMEREARSALLDQRGGLRRLAETPSLGDSWAACVDRDDSLVVLAEVDGVPMGWLWASGPDDLGVASVNSVYVTEGARELGLGDDLVEWALRWARNRGAISLDSWALPGDRDTKNLFERNGLTARLITVSRSLGDD